MTLAAGGFVRSRKADRRERRLWPWARYVAVAQTPGGHRGQGAAFTRAGAERQARADAVAAQARQQTVRVRQW